jgi:hypothetical protein
VCFVLLHSSHNHLCDILAQCLIGFNRILIPPRHTIFFESLPTKNFEIKRAWPEAISGWVTDREVFSGVHK